MLTIRKFIVNEVGNESFMHQNIYVISHMIMICNSQRSILFRNYNTAKVSQFIFLRLVISVMLAINCMKLRCIENHEQAAKYCKLTQFRFVKCSNIVIPVSFSHDNTLIDDMTCVSLTLLYQNVEEQNIGNVLLNKALFCCRIKSYEYTLRSQIELDWFLWPKWL